LRAALAAIGGGFAIAAVAVLLLEKAPAPGGLLELPSAAWRLVSGRLEAAGGGGQDFVAPQAARLESPGASLDLGPGTRLRFREEDAGLDGDGALILPELLDGAFTIDSGVDLDLDGVTLRIQEPEPRARLTLTPQVFAIVEGVVVIDGRILPIGSTHERLSLRERFAARSDGEPESAPGSIETAPPSGRIVDARDGAPIASARVRATYSYSADGYPPHPQEGSQSAASTDGAGFFRLEPFRPEDPLLYLHLEIDRDGYLPRVHVIDDAADVEGRRDFVRLELRRGETAPLVLLDPEGRPLPGAALEASAGRPDPFPGEDAWDNDQALMRDRRTIRYTDAAGRLEIGLGGTRLQLLHPWLHLRDDEIKDILDAVVLPPSEEKEPRRLWRLPFELHSERGEPETCQLLDGDGAPASGLLLEIALEGMPAIRLHAGPEGEFDFAAWPRRFKSVPHPPPPLSYEHPRAGAITALSPWLWKRRCEVALPALLREFRVDGRLGSRLELRCTGASGGSAPAPLSPEGLHLDADGLSLVERRPDGTAVFAGALPPPRSALHFSVRGALPAAVEMPDHPLGSAAADLDELRFDRGETLEVALAGAAAAAPHAVFFIADADAPELRMRYRFDGGGRAAASGLERGGRYLYAVEAPRCRRLEGEIFATAELIESGLRLELEAAEEIDIAVRGQVQNLRQEERHRYRVIERYFPADGAEPLLFASYAMPPDGILGSRRFLKPVRAVEAFVLGPGLEGIQLAKPALPDPQRIDFGLVRPRTLPHAIFRFQSGKLGFVQPPADATLAAESNRNHDVARLELVEGHLVVINVLPGRHTLRWGEAEGSPEAFEFEMLPQEQVLRAVIDRRPLPVEEIEVRLVDAAGKPAAAESIESGAGTGRPLVAAPDYAGAGLPAADGRYRIPLRTGAANRIAIRPVDAALLALTVELAEGIGPPGEIVLERAIEGRGTILDVDQRRLDGEVAVAWEPARAADDGLTAPELRVLHGSPPLSVRVLGGNLVARGLPPGAHRFTFRLAGSEAQSIIDLDLFRGQRAHLGVLQLAETRSLRGTVVEPDGRPAARALVALVEPKRARRFPGRALKLGEEAFSARADALGRFEIAGLPLDLSRELALVASLEGWTDAIESPLDLEAAEHPLVLRAPTLLRIEAGYADGEAHPSFRFRLSVVEAAEPGGEIDLGPLAPTPRGGAVHPGIEPGLYRLRWGLAEPLPWSAERVAEALVAPGAESALGLRILDRFATGDAYFNGERLERGWALIAGDPDDEARFFWGRVLAGRFEVPLPRVDRAFVSLLPERDPLPRPNFSRGELLPIEYTNFRFDAPRRQLRIDYQAFDLTYTLPRAGPGSHRGYVIEFPHYDWTGRKFDQQLRSEGLEDGVLTLRCIPAGIFALRISGPGGWRHLRDLDIRSDTHLRVEGGGRQ
jgi:hypothetical protein